MSKAKLKKPYFIQITLVATNNRVEDLITLFSKNDIKYKLR